MVNVYPFGPVDLDTNGMALVNWKSRFSIALGMSLGDLSTSAKSRIKGDNAFVYGLGYRINKYFRVSVGGMTYRDAGSGNGLLNELFIGPSIDLTALPGLKQIFASASGKSSGTPAAGTPPASTPPAAKPPAGTPPAGTPPTGTPPAK